MFKFCKMHGAGNDFIVIDDRGRHFPDDDAAFIRGISARGTGIGCEGILLLREADASHGFDFKMVFLNPDGSRAAMCGNASRCAALFAYVNGLGGRRQRIETDSGDITAEILNSESGREIVRVRMPKLKSRRTVNVKTRSAEYVCRYIDSGVPHAVIFVRDVASVDVNGEGRLLRFAEEFAPDGANVDFVEIKNASELVMRTYERGVEGESGACGTGAAASAAVFAEAKTGVFPVSVKVSSGDTLVVDGKLGVDGRCVEILVSGPARFVYDGTLDRKDFTTRRIQ